jgi:hypothetical protein
LGLYTGRFDGFHSVPSSLSETCLVRFAIPGHDKASFAAAIAAFRRNASCTGLPILIESQEF